MLSIFMRMIRTYDCTGDKKVVSGFDPFKIVSYLLSRDNFPPVIVFYGLIVESLDEAPIIEFY